MFKLLRILTAAHRAHGAEEAAEFRRDGIRRDLLAAAIAERDGGWKQFADYGLASAHRPAGYLAAQASYWWHQGRDWFKTRLEA